MPRTDRAALQISILVVAAWISGLRPGTAQVSPQEIRSPQLKSLETTYFQELKALNQEIAGTKFPFPFVLSRYVGVDPKEQSGTDTRGLEFVRFHDRTSLKVSGNYHAAFNAEVLTQNQRANRVLDEVIGLILGLIPKYFANPQGFDTIGFEIAFHVRRDSAHYNYEGKEILVLVFNKEDAFRYTNTKTDDQKQEILNGSEIYLDGKEFGLALGSRDPLMIEDLDRAHEEKPSRDSRAELAPAPAKLTAPPPQGPGVRLPGINNSDLPLGLRPPASQTPASPPTTIAPAPSNGKPPTQADVDALQAQTQSQLDTLAKEGAKRFQMVAYAPPTLALFRDQIYLQVTLRNPAPFDKSQSSIYKRAAQSFDLFLAPLLKDLVSKAPAGPQISGFDITVLNQFASTSSSSEAVEFICPYPALQQFTDYRITNQDLINQSVVLVNGVRIALNLQQVE